MFAERLKAVREERGITQSQLAEALGVGRATIAGYEAGNRREPDYATLTKLADFFGISVDWLLGRTVAKDMKVTDVHTIDDLKRYLGVDEAIRIAAEREDDSIPWTEEEIEDVRRFIRFLRTEKHEKILKSDHGRE